MRAMVDRYAHLMRLRKGCGRAAEVIESVIYGGVDFQELWRGVPGGDGACVLDEDGPKEAASPCAQVSIGVA